MVRVERGREQGRAAARLGAALATARQSDEGGCFEVDLGNRLLTLALHGVDGARHDAHVLQWIDALNNQQVIGEVQSAGSDIGKILKPDKAQIAAQVVEDRENMDVQ